MAKRSPWCLRLLNTFDGMNMSARVRLRAFQSRIHLLCEVGIAPLVLVAATLVAPLVAAR